MFRSKKVASSGAPEVVRSNLNNLRDVAIFDKSVQPESKYFGPTISNPAAYLLNNWWHKNQIF